MAALWITACIHLHNFVLINETTANLETDEFFQEGLDFMADEGDERAMEQLRLEELAIFEEDQRATHADLGLREGQAKREALKRALIRHLDNNNDE